MVENINYLYNIGMTFLYQDLKTTVKCVTKTLGKKTNLD